jgi:outer membrane protein assembly factor BamB
MKLPLLIVSAACVLAAAADWPQFRGPSASGIGDGPQPPVHWNASTRTNILWQTPIPGLAVSSPVVWGGRVYLTTAISSSKQSLRIGLYGDTDPVQDISPHQWKVIALDKNSGRILWERTAHSGLPKTKRHPKSSQASPTPVTNGKIVVAWFGSEGLYAYSNSGDLLWKKDLGLQSPALPPSRRTV